MFTRFHRVDIDVEELEVIRSLPLSDSSDLAMRLRGALPWPDGSRPRSGSPAVSTPASTSSRRRWRGRT